MMKTEEVSKDDIYEVLHNFQKGKSPRLDGWPIEIFLGFSKVTEYILMSEESKII